MNDLILAYRDACIAAVAAKDALDAAKAVFDQAEALFSKRCSEAGEAADRLLNVAAGLQNAP